VKNKDKTKIIKIIFKIGVKNNNISASQPPPQRFPHCCNFDKGQMRLQTTV